MKQLYTKDMWILVHLAQYKDVKLLSKYLMHPIYKRKSKAGCLEKKRVGRQYEHFSRKLNSPFFFFFFLEINKAGGALPLSMKQTGLHVNSITGVSSVAQFCLTLCNPIDCSTPGFPVHYQLLELAQNHVHWGEKKNHVHRVSDAI